MRVCALCEQLAWLVSPYLLFIVFTMTYCNWSLSSVQLACLALSIVVNISHCGWLLPYLLFIVVGHGLAH